MGMAVQSLQNPILSFLDVIQRKELKSVFENRLIAMLKKRLKELRIIWSPQAFKGGLNNHDLPAEILRKLESIILISESLNWKISTTLKNELDTTVEDIETFNPPFIKRMKKISEEVKAGKFITFEELQKKLSLGKG